MPENHKIFIVEDVDNVAGLLLGLLHRFGYQTSRVADYKAIGSEVKAARPDLIILDINLPQYDGFYGCNVLRQFTTVTIPDITRKPSPSEVGSLRIPQTDPAQDGFVVPASQGVLLNVSQYGAQSQHPTKQYHVGNAHAAHGRPIPHPGQQG